MRRERTGHYLSAALEAAKDERTAVQRFRRSSARSAARGNGIVLEHNSIEGLSVVVVGGESRVGRAIALTASERGADLVVIGRSRTALATLVKEAPGQCESVWTDFSQPDWATALASTLSPFDHLISTMSIRATGESAYVTRESLESSFETEAFGPMQLARATTPLVHPKGSFTFFSDQASWTSSQGTGDASTVDAALAFLVGALAVEFSPIRINAVATDLLDADLHDRFGGKGNGVIAGDAKQCSGCNVGSTQDVVDATLMFVVDGYMTGTVAHVVGETLV